jgi:YgiT-type zinc finger domain-containing protein
MASKQSGIARVESAMKAWHAEHPAATLAELEAELDQQLAGARATLLTELVADGTAAVPTVCPACGHRLVQRGRHTRALDTEGGGLITLTRHYARCPACHAGLFPPG